MSKTVAVRVPTNIAFLKYWGKSDEAFQWPANDSLSMTLDLYTETKATVTDQPDHIVIFEGNELNPQKDKKAEKIFRFLSLLEVQTGFSKKLRIETSNQFPTGCGIASSASGLGAITLASIAAWCDVDSWEELETSGFSRQDLAQLSRLGSGSACRSFWGGFVKWERGEVPSQQKVGPLASNWDLVDTIVVLSDQEKEVSSTEAHRYAWDSLLFRPRLSGLKERMKNMEGALLKKDMEYLGPLLETEALEMHAVMMSSKQPCVFMNEESSQFISWLRTERVHQNIPVYFTMDAGPNVHLIHEKKASSAVKTLLNSSPISMQKIISSAIGVGPAFQ